MCFNYPAPNWWLAAATDEMSCTALQVHPICATAYTTLPVPLDRSNTYIICNEWRYIFICVCVCASVVQLLLIILYVQTPKRWRWVRAAEVRAATLSFALSPLPPKTMEGDERQQRSGVRPTLSDWKKKQNKITRNVAIQLNP